MSKHNQDPGFWRQTNFTRPWYQSAIKLISNLNCQQVIELGSGNGELAKLIKPQVNSLTCTDNSKIYIQKLSTKGLKAIQVDFNQKLPFKSNHYDLAISLEVIEHIVDAEEFLKEINRILKPGGKLIISTPNIAWYGYRLFCLLGNPPKKEGYHFRFFTYHTFVQKLKMSGFKIKIDTSFTTIPFLNRLLISLNLKPIYPETKLWPNLLAQNLVFLCQKKS
jgi:2-polyprenyl-3-methyl-5-hydroxy-6-metoxy-1,4-benzoquinol methylase